MDEKHHLAKVRVAGSNPVFRSRNWIAPRLDHTDQDRDPIVERRAVGVYKPSPRSSPWSFVCRSMVRSRIW